MDRGVDRSLHQTSPPPQHRKMLPGHIEALVPKLSRIRRNGDGQSNRRTGTKGSKSNRGEKEADLKKRFLYVRKSKTERSAVRQF